MADLPNGHMYRLFFSESHPYCLNRQSLERPRKANAKDLSTSSQFGTLLLPFYKNLVLLKLGSAFLIAFRRCSVGTDDVEKSHKAKQGGYLFWTLLIFGIPGVIAPTKTCYQLFLAIQCRTAKRGTSLW